MPLSAWDLFAANVVYNVLLGAIIVAIFGRRPGAALARVPPLATSRPDPDSNRDAEIGARPELEHACTVLALAAVAVISLGFGLTIGFVALAAGAVLQLAFPRTTTGAERQVAWPVVLLVCGIVTYVAALQRYGTVDAVGNSILGLGTPLVVALLLCAVGAVTSAFASSAGIVGALIPLAAPLMLQGVVGTTGLIVALALSATVVDATPFSTVGALVVANASEEERAAIYRGLLGWGAAMAITAPVITWLVFVVPGW